MPFGGCAWRVGGNGMEVAHYSFGGGPRNIRKMSEMVSKSVSKANYQSFGLDNDGRKILWKENSSRRSFTNSL